MRLPGDGFTYAFLAGTSQAAPHVAGVASLMRALDPTLDADKARAIIRATADPSGRCDDGCGGGLLDASAALAAVAAGCTDGHCDDTLQAGSIKLVGGCSTGGRAPGSPFAVGGLLLLGAIALRRRRG
jgi:serine protease